MSTKTAERDEQTGEVSGMAVVGASQGEGGPSNDSFEEDDLRSYYYAEAYEETRIQMRISENYGDGSQGHRRQGCYDYGYKFEPRTC